MTKTATKTIFPWFTLENHETLRPWLGLQEMRDTLSRGGFKVKQALDLDGQILNLELSQPPCDSIYFEAELPDGWSIAPGYGAYGFRNGSLLHLLDAKKRLRGWVHLDWKDNYRPEKAMLYCRYALNPANHHTIRIKWPKDSINYVVVDRTAVDHTKPAEFPVIVHHQSDPAKKGPLVIPSIAETRKWCDEEAERIKARRPKLNPPVYRWLHENYPDWRDPFAYW